MIRLKAGVSLDNTHHKVFHALGFAHPIWQRYGAPDLWVTGANEAGHSTGPRGFHRLPDGTCQAVDLRTVNIPKSADRQAAIEELAKVLGDQYDVLFEEELKDATGKVTRGEHCHVQFDPDRPGTH